MGASLSLAKQEKAPEDDPFGEIWATAWEEPAFLPTQTQRRRTEALVRSDEEAYRKKQYPTVHERIAAQEAWAKQQLQEAKIAAQHAALKRSAHAAIASAQQAVPENFDQVEQELDKLLKETEEDLMGGSGSGTNKEIARQVLDLKERKVLSKRGAGAAQYHRHYSLWQRRKKALAFKLGLLRRTDGDASLVLPWLLLGRRELACDQTKLLALSVTHILNMTHDCPNMFPDAFVYQRVPVRDSLENDLSEHWATIVSFIKRAEACKGRILVHCTAGASRAPSAVLAFLLIEKRLPLLDAYAFLTALRPVVQPNTHFLFQLAMLEVKVCGSCSVLFHHHWRFYEFNTFRSQDVPGRRGEGEYCTLMTLYSTALPVEGSAALKQLFNGP